MRKRIGLVLSGGADRGAFQIGVLKALKEYNILPMISGIAGTSIGAVNSLFAIQGTIVEAEEVWLSMTPLKIFNMNTLFTKMDQQVDRNLVPFFITKWILTRMQKGLFSLDTLQKIIIDHINLSRISQSRIVSYTTAVELNSMQKKFFKLNKAAPEQILYRTLASAAIPFLFDPVQVDGKYYVDGGLPAPYGENIPITPLYELGFNLMIVVYLDENDKIASEFYPNAKFIAIHPPKKLTTGFETLFTFNKQLTQERINLGYQEAKRILSDNTIRKLLTM